MIEDDFDIADFASDAQTGRRLANVISVLLPARQYRLECSWTTEQPLPAVEEFACKLILVTDGVSPSELRGYFGLSALEADGLVKSLVKNRLVDVADDGILHPSTMLQAKSIHGTEVPTFTSFETREEDAVFDLLALQIVPRRGYGNSRFGLPEIPIPDSSRSLPLDRIAEAFSDQYRAYLDFARGRPGDDHRTKLYKISSCRAMKTLQIPIDMDVSLEVGPRGDLRVYRDAVERLGENRRRPLSNALETQVTDYLAEKLLPECTSSFADFCELVRDQVLARYARDDGMDIAQWLVDRSARKTGYGQQDTRALLGPIYLRENRIAIERLLQPSSDGGNESAIAHWFPADVPFWAANSSELADFGRKLQRSLSWDGSGRLVACLRTIDSSDPKRLKQKYNTRIPHAVGFEGNILLDRIELLVVPDRLVVAQYHLQPDQSSAITLPIGFVSVDSERVSTVMKLLSSRLSASRNVSILWSEDSNDIKSLVELQRLGFTQPMQPTGGPITRDDGHTSTRESGNAVLLDGKIVWKRAKRSDNGSSDDREPSV